MDNPPFLVDQNGIDSTLLSFDSVLSTPTDLNDGISLPPGKGSRAGVLRSLLNVRQNVQQTLDDAFLNGHISVDSAAWLDREISGHFAAALKAASSDYVSTAGDSRRTMIGTLQDQTGDGFNSQSNLEPFPDGLLPTPFSLFGDDTFFQTECTPAAPVDEPRATKRRKRMPRVEGAYQCRHCSKSFDRAGDRTKHEAVHEPDKKARYRCTQCRRAFFYPKDLKRHIARLHEESKAPKAPSTASYFPPIPDGLNTDLAEMSRVSQVRRSPPQSVPLPLFEQPKSCSSDSETRNSCLCPGQEECIVVTLALLRGSIGLLVLAAVHHAVIPTEFPKLSAGFQRLEKYVEGMVADPTPNSCAAVRQRMSARSLEPLEIIPPAQHCTHVLLSLLDYQDESFQGQIEELQQSNPDEMGKQICAANACLSRSSIKAYQSQFGVVMDELLTGLDGIAALWTS